MEDLNFIKEEDNNNSNSDQNPKAKKKYSVITQEVREKFIKRVISREVTIKEAAREFGIKFSTSKAILQTFKREGRIGKKKTRQRKLSHNDQETAGGSNHSPKHQSQNTFKQGKSGEEGQKVNQGQSGRGSGQGGISGGGQGGGNPLYRNAFPAQLGGQGLENSDQNMIDNDMKTTIYEMQATIQDGYPIYEPALQNPLSFPLMKPEMMMDGKGGLIPNPVMMGGPQMGGPMFQGWNAPNPHYMYQQPSYGYPQQNYYAYQNPQMMFQPMGMQPYPMQSQPMMPPMQIPQQQPMGMSQQQKIPRPVYYPNPYNTTTSSASANNSENNGPTYIQIREQIKNINTDQLKQNAVQYSQKEHDRETEFNYSKYYH